MVGTPQGQDVGTSCPSPHGCHLDHKDTGRVTRAQAKGSPNLSLGARVERGSLWVSEARREVSLLRKPQDLPIQPGCTGRLLWGFWGSQPPLAAWPPQLPPSSLQLQEQNQKKLTQETTRPEESRSGRPWTPTLRHWGCSLGSRSARLQVPSVGRMSPGWGLPWTLLLLWLPGEGLSKREEGLRP